MNKEDFINSLKAVKDLTNIEEFDTDGDIRARILLISDYMDNILLEAEQATFGCACMCGGCE